MCLCFGSLLCPFGGEYGISILIEFEIIFAIVVAVVVFLSGVSVEICRSLDRIYYLLGRKWGRKARRRRRYNRRTAPSVLDTVARNFSRWWFMVLLCQFLSFEMDGMQRRCGMDVVFDGVVRMEKTSPTFDLTIPVD